MRILRLVSENVKRLNAVEISPDGDAIVIGGKNEQGKTSVLDSIMMALGGTGTHPPSPVRIGAKKATITLDLGDEKGVKLVVRKEIKANGPVNLVVESADGAVHRSPQTILDALVGAIAFDPSEFARMKPKQQAETLRSIVPELDFTELEEERASLYEERRVVNRQANEAESVANDLLFHPNAPAEAVDVSLLTSELERRLGVNQQNERRRSDLDAMDQELLAIQEKVAEAKGRLARAEKDLSDAEKAMDDAIVAHAESEEIVNALEDENVDEIRAQIAAVKTTNEQVADNAKRKSAIERASQFARKAEALSDAIEKLDDRKREAIQNAKFPIIGLGFGENGVTYNGVPFEQASQSERWRASIAIGIAMNPKLRVMLIREGALLDDERLKMIAEMAKENDVQLWIEDVGDGRASVVIHDGSVKES